MYTEFTGECAITPYEKLKTTTITAIIPITGNVRPDLAFQLMPVSRVEIKQTRNTKKCKLPHLDIPGSIISIRYRRHTRGLIKNKLSPFKNSATLDMSISKKNISIKLAKETIHMCGCSSKDDALEASKYIFMHLRAIQKKLDAIQNNKQNAIAAVDWVKKNSKGNVVHIISDKILHFNNVSLLIKNKKEDFTIDAEKCVRVPKGMDKGIIVFLLQYAGDFMYHSDFCAKLDYILQLTKIIEGPLSVIKYSEAMVNYNYSLGYDIDREKLNEYINSDKNIKSGFISRYNNALATSVTIELPYTPENGSTIKRRKNKIPHHSFLVYKSGSVTQSGPGGNIMKSAYYDFMQIIMGIKKDVELKVPPMSTPRMVVKAKKSGRTKKIL